MNSLPATISNGFPSVGVKVVRSKVLPFAMDVP